MLSGHNFIRIRDRKRVRATRLKPNDKTLLKLLSQEVVERFARVSDLIAWAIVIGPSDPEDADEPVPQPGHSECLEHRGSDYCRESWQLHLAELRSRPETHWHKCDYGKRCALVPIVYQDQCLAAIKVACPASVSEVDFERQVELLDVLAKDFMVSWAAFLGRLLQARPIAAEIMAPHLQSAEHRVGQQLGHPQVLRALEYIQKHLSDPKLTVGRIGSELGVNSNHLSHLFANELGQRMGRFIASRRVEMAKHLLATTGWQVKRIAHETGHANPNWFCQVFGVQTGLSPGEYRKALGRKRAGTSSH